MAKDNLKLKENPAEEVGTSDFYYDLFDGGYIVPEDFLEEESAKRVNEALLLIREFENLLVSEELIEYM